MQHPQTKSTNESEPESQLSDLSSPDTTNDQFTRPFTFTRWQLLAQTTLTPSEKEEKAAVRPSHLNESTTVTTANHTRPQWIDLTADSEDENDDDEVKYHDHPHRITAPTLDLMSTKDRREFVHSYLRGVDLTRHTIKLIPDSVRQHGYSMYDLQQNQVLYGLCTESEAFAPHQGAAAREERQRLERMPPVPPTIEKSEIPIGDDEVDFVPAPSLRHRLDGMANTTGEMEEEYTPPSTPTRDSMASRPPPSVLNENGNERFEYECIIGYRMDGPDKYYLVKWKDYPWSECTWEEASHVDGVHASSLDDNPSLDESEEPTELVMDVSDEEDSEYDEDEED